MVGWVSRKGASQCKQDKFVGLVEAAVWGYEGHKVLKVGHILPGVTAACTGRFLVMEQGVVVDQEDPAEEVREKKLDKKGLAFRWRRTLCGLMGALALSFRCHIVGWLTNVRISLFWVVDYVKVCWVKIILGYYFGIGSWTGTVPPLTESLILKFHITKMKWMLTRD